MDRYSILIFPCNKIERNFLISKKFRRKKMDCSLNNTKIKIQWIQKEFKRASILETELGINLDKQKQLISHCAFPLSRYLFFVFPRSFFSTKTENDRSISSRILLNELFSAYIGDRWSLRSNKSPVFFHLEAHPFVFFPRLLPYLHPVSLSLSVLP